MISTLLLPDLPQTSQDYGCILFHWSTFDLQVMTLLEKHVSHSTMSYKFPIAINLEMEFYAQLYYLYICFALNLGFTHAVTTTVSLHVHSS